MNEQRITFSILFSLIVSGCSSTGMWESEEYSQFLKDCQGGMTGAVGELQSSFCNCNAKYLSERATYEQLQYAEYSNLTYESMGICAHHISEEKMTEAIKYEMEKLQDKY